MYNLLKWMEMAALADAGVEEGRIKEVASYSDTKLGAMIPETNPALPKVLAMRELGRDYRNMDGGRFVEVMTTAMFNDYFTDTISRMFYSDYEYTGGSWRNYTYADRVPDFRDVDRHRMSEPETLLRRAEQAELTSTYIEDSVISYGVESYGRQFDVSWETIVNDDLSKIKQTPERMAKAARRWLDKWVSNLYDNATTQAAMVALGSNYSGTGTLTAANLQTALNAMTQRTDGNGDTLNISRVHLVIPPRLQITAADILKDVIQYGGSGSNVLGDYVTTVQVDPYITGSVWYLVADPSEIPTITVARMTGWDGPFVFMKKSNIESVIGRAPSPFMMGSFETGTIAFGVQDIIGGWDDATYAGVTDYQGLYYSTAAG